MSDNLQTKFASLCDKCYFKKCWKCFLMRHIDFASYPANQIHVFPERYNSEWYTNNKWWPNGNSLDAKKKTEGNHPSIIKNIAGSGTVLDVGCGQGFLVRFLRELGVEAYGIDYSEDAIKTCVGNPKDYYCFDATHLLDGSGKEPWQTMFEKGVDMVIAREMFEHMSLKDAEIAFKGMLKISKKYLYFTVWLNFSIFANDYEYGSDIRDDTHITFATRKFWEDRFKEWSGGRITELKEFEKSLDWLDKRRCFVYEKKSGGTDINV